MTQQISDAQFDQVTNEGLTLIQFWAPWCGPCRMQKPVIEELDAEMENVNFYQMNIDEEQEVAGQFGIMSIPTLLLKKDGEVVDKLVGFHDKARLQEILKNHL